MFGVIVHSEDQFAPKLQHCGWCLQMLLKHVRVIYFVKCISPFCSKTPPQHDAVAPTLHSWDDVLRLQSFLLFPWIYSLSLQFSFCLVRPQDMSPKTKTKIIVPMLQTVVWLFYDGFQVMAFSSQSNLSARGTGLILLWMGRCFSIVSQHLHKVFSWWVCFAHFTQKNSSLGLRIRLLPEQYDGCTFPCFYTCVLLSELMNVGRSVIWKLHQ